MTTAESGAQSSCGRQSRYESCCDTEDAGIHESARGFGTHSQVKRSNSRRADLSKKIEGVAFLGRVLSVLSVSPQRV